MVGKLAGLDENLSIFVKNVELPKLLFELRGDHLRLTHSELEKSLQSGLNKYLQQQEERMLYELAEAPTVLTDLQDIWRSVSEGNGYTLLVERDFKQPVYIKDVFLDGQLQSFEKRIEDVVDDILKQMLKIQGKVIFVENDRLSQFGHMAPYSTVFGISSS